MAETTAPLLASQWSLWMSHPTSELDARIGSDLAGHSIDSSMTAAIVEFVREYRNGGKNWSSNGLRGDEVIAPLLGLAKHSPEVFDLFRLKVAKAQHNKWVGGSLDGTVATAQKQYTKFVIISTPRSGTHLLRTLLGSHPCIEMHGEAFNRFGQHLLPYTVQDTTAEHILERHLFRPYFEYVQAVGFVLFRDLDSEWGGVNVWETLAGLPDLKIILLDRRNRLERMFSLKKSLLDHVWYVGRDDERARGYVRLSVAQKELVDFIDHDLANRAAFCERFGHHDILSIEYEQLLDNPESTHAELLAFLGVSVVRLEPGTGKKETASISSIVENDAQLRSSIRGTPYERYI
ncbi:sulfotransferase family protein [Xanthomonas oryzae]|uniref:sulfotransferase family protein n=1 Tax=Xanthomonas oryzae TaxID=347 RepID=UPI00036707AF|nr:sulfotransferase [Xanthomonas oryzae]